jgi:hypothetical protein
LGLSCWRSRIVGSTQGHPRKRSAVGPAGWRIARPHPKVTVGGDRWHGHDGPTSLESALRQLISDLRRDGVSFALVGGLAVSVRTEPRLTRDADVAVSVADDTEAEAVVYRLVERGYRAGAPLSSTSPVVLRRRDLRIGTVPMPWLISCSPRAESSRRSWAPPRRLRY